MIFNPTWGTKTAQVSGYGVAAATNAQYIQVKGGPHSGTFYSTTSNRTSNLEFGGPSGSTIEFFYNKLEGMPASSLQGEKQVIFDLWNGAVSSSAAHGRLRVEIFSGSEDRFHVTMLSGTKGYFQNSFKVYNQEQEKCRSAYCDGTIVKLFISNRSTFFCKKCQK